MPHAKQGGRLVDTVAVAGSKLDGTGFEKEHIEQIQVAFTGFGDGDFGCEARSCEVSVLAGWRFEACGIDGLLPTLLEISSLFFAGFGCRTIFADDFRKPA